MTRTYPEEGEESMERRPPFVTWEDSRFQVVYWPTENVCAAYETREEADAAVRWYEKTYGPLGDKIGIRDTEKGSEQ